jgi:flavin reductase
MRMSLASRQTGALTPPSGQFRAAIRELPMAMGVVSFVRERSVVAFAASSVAALSSDPPILAVCIERSALCSELRATTAAFGVNILSSDQWEAASQWAGGLSSVEEAQELRWTVAGDGAPLLVGALVVFDCTLDEIIERHDCALILARVRAVAGKQGAAALVRRRGALEQLGWSAEEVAKSIGVAPARYASAARL